MGEGVTQVKVCFSEMQSSIQQFLLVAAFVAVPFLLLPIPFIEMYQHSKSAKSGHARLADEDKEDEGDAHGGDHHGEEFSVGDAFIHQGIHTIEFVLGSISISLAHSQLAELFKDMVLGLGLSPGYEGDKEAALGLPHSVVGTIIHVFVLWFTYATWLIMSFVVLMVMENLSSFLHALRLQWVEFQNKFFYGDGVRFAPFSFKNIASACGLCSDALVRSIQACAHTVHTTFVEAVVRRLLSSKLRERIINMANCEVLLQ